MKLHWTNAEWLQDGKLHRYDSYLHFLLYIDFTTLLTKDLKCNR